MNRRGAVLVETVLVTGAVLFPLFFYQVEWLSQKRRELSALQSRREIYDGKRLWKSVEKSGE